MAAAKVAAQKCKEFARLLNERLDELQYGHAPAVNALTTVDARTISLHPVNNVNTLCVLARYCRFSSTSTLVPPGSDTKSTAPSPLTSAA